MIKTFGNAVLGSNLQCRKLRQVSEYGPWFPTRWVQCGKSLYVMFPALVSRVIEYGFNKNYHPIPWRDSISRPIAPISGAAGGDVTT
jgi:hypothetical protein